MNKIKDIIYDFNDIFVALLIVGLTAGILLWRINVIMAYPEYLESGQQVQEQLDTSFEGVDLKHLDADPNMTADADAVEANWDDATSDENIGDANEGDVGDGTAAQTGEGTQTGTGTGSDDKSGTGSEGQQGTEGSEGQSGEVTIPGLTGGKTDNGEFITLQEVKFSVPKGASGTKVGTLLEEAGLVESKQAFITALTKAKKENRIQVGTFTIPAGSTVEDIVNIVTK